MDLTTLAIALPLLTAMCAGTVELIKRLFKRDFEAASYIAASAVVGGLAGVFLLPAVGLPIGIVAGLAASGVITGMQKIGENGIVPTVK